MNHPTEMPFAEAIEIAENLRQRVGDVIFGQEDLVSETLCCFLAGGHILMTGAPGLAKTTLVRVFARQLGLSFGRVQYTPDLLPSDIIGSEILNIDTETGRRTFEFSKGPVFVNLLLADEINRASPRTQSALLESMQERRVTVGGQNYPLPKPFMVFATQNPLESEGTFPLPEAQLDRFLVSSWVEYPDEASELRIIQAHAERQLVGESEFAPIMESLEMEKVQSLIKRVSLVRVDETLLQLISELVRATRPEDMNCPEALRSQIRYGAGPRGGISLVSMAQAFALTDGSEEVRWRHIRRMAKPVLRHRMRVNLQAEREGLNEDACIDQLLTALESRHHALVKGE